MEALTEGLAAHGRADPREGWSSTTYLQVLDPALFGGEAGFRRQMTHRSDTCRNTPPRPGFDGVRLPGESGLRKRERQLESGIIAANFALGHSLMNAGLVGYSYMFFAAGISYSVVLD